MTTLKYNQSRCTGVSRSLQVINATCAAHGCGEPRGGGMPFCKSIQWRVDTHRGVLAHRQRNLSSAYQYTTHVNAHAYITDRILARRQ